MAIDRQDSPYRLGNRYEVMPIPMVPEHCVTVDAGPVQLVVESRHLTDQILADTYVNTKPSESTIHFDDFGATLHVCGTADGLEYLRFDCFENEPHYHYIKQEERAHVIVRIDELALGDSVSFALACVEGQLPAMLRNSGADKLADAVDAETTRVVNALPAVKALMERARQANAGSATTSGTSNTPAAHDAEELSSFLPLIDPDATQQAVIDAGLRQAFAKVNLFRTTLHHPDIARIVAVVVDTLVMNSVLDARTREVAILRVGWRIGSVYEWSNHVVIARRAGMSDDEIIAVRGGAALQLLTDTDRCAIAVVDEVLAGVAVSASTLLTARSLLRNDQAVLELLMIPGCYRTIGTVLLSVGVPLEEHVEAWAPDGIAAR
jgi:alkylhydroperoxidase family enzyme